MECQGFSNDRCCEVDAIQEQKSAYRFESISPVNFVGKIKTLPPSQYYRNTHFQPCHHSYSCNKILNVSHHHNFYGNKKGKKSLVRSNRVNAQRY